MKRVSQVIAILLASVLVTLGFNTLDVMMWTFYWTPWKEWFPQHIWYWTPTVFADVWLSYIVGGILPISIGSFLLGWMLRSWSVSESDC